MVAESRGVFLLEIVYKLSYLKYVLIFSLGLPLITTYKADVQTILLPSGYSFTWIEINYDNSKLISYMCYHIVMRRWYLFPDFSKHTLPPLLRNEGQV